MHTATVHPPVCVSVVVNLKLLFLYHTVYSVMRLYIVPSER